MMKYRNIDHYLKVFNSNYGKDVNLMNSAGYENALNLLIENNIEEANIYETTKAKSKKKFARNVKMPLI